MLLLLRQSAHTPDRRPENRTGIQAQACRQQTDAKEYRISLTENIGNTRHGRKGRAVRYYIRVKKGGSYGSRYHRECDYCGTVRDVCGKARQRQKERLCFLWIQRLLHGRTLRHEECAGAVQAEEALRCAEYFIYVAEKKPHGCPLMDICGGFAFYALRQSLSFQELSLKSSVSS